MPPLVLSGCTDAVVDGAPELAGTWQVVDAQQDGKPLGTDHPIWKHVERIEQAGDRVILASSGVAHDMIVDGTFDNGVNDVMAADLATPISVAASFENGVIVLRPRDLPDVEVRRWCERDQLVWQYHTFLKVRMQRVEG
jgi:hypothetical protein